ncbi:MAG: DJ-1/PfpI family protein [Tumebacillaceae bacterium]
MKKVLFFLYEKSAEFEIAVLATALNGQADVVTCTLTREPITSVGGMKMVGHLTVDEVNPQDFDALVIPGGVCHPLLGEQELLEMIRGFHAQGKVIGAICAGPSFLAAAGVLDGVKFATSLEKHNLEYLDVISWDNVQPERVYTDGNIVTATGSSYVDFAEAVLRALGVEDHDVEYFRTPSMQ